MTVEPTLKSVSTRIICVGVATLMLSSCGLIGRRSVNQPVDDLPAPTASAPAFPTSASLAPTGQAQQLDANRINVLNNLLRQGPVGRYTVGTPYTIGGQRYTPQENLSYIEQGLASWYGPGLSGNPTSNGERFNPNAHTAAHRTLPFSSIVRVTNLANNRSTLVRINDRGPFLANHIIDLSQKAAQDLGMVTSQGSQVRVEVMQAETRAVANATGGSVGAGGSSNFSSNFSGQAPLPSLPTTNVNPPINLASTTLTPLPVPQLPTVNSSSSVTVTPIAAPVSATSTSVSSTSSVVPLPPLPVPSAPRISETSAVTTTSLSAPADQAAGYYVQAGSYSSRENAEQVRNKLSSVGNVVIFPVMVAGSQRFRVRVGPFATREQAQAKLGTVIVSGGPDAIVVKEG